MSKVTVKFKVPDDMTTKEVKAVIERAFLFAGEDYRNCREADKDHAKEAASHQKEIDDLESLRMLSLEREIACCKAETAGRVFQCACPDCVKPLLKTEWRVSTKPLKDINQLHPDDLCTYAVRPLAWIGEHYTEEEALDAFHAQVPIKRLEDFEIDIKPRPDEEIVLVYFESDTHAEQVAIFYGDATYDHCLPALESLAKKDGMTVTESIKATKHDLFKLIEELDDAT